MTILCYHAVDPRWESPLSMPPGGFRRHCRWLARHRRVISLKEATERVDSRARLPSGLCSLTFDDGLCSVLDHALPALVDNGLSATVFLVAATLSSPPQQVDWIDELPAGVVGTLTLDQIKELAACGVDFGSHSYSHRDLRSLTEEECFKDLKNARELIEDLLSRPVPFLAYPRGLHNDSVRRAARRAGYTHAFGTARQRVAAGPWAIPRMGIYSHDREIHLRIKSTRWYETSRTSRAYNALRARLSR
jgi:peptidoglycan/xylan/chitin deacetylase (PgdA/CDA1 family)